MPEIKDREAVTRLLKREPQGDFEVVLRSDDGDPRVIKNHPLLYDLTPMPTLYWLVGKQDCLNIARLESKGYIKLAESEIDPEALKSTHEQYKKERDEILSVSSPDYEGPLPSGGVGGTARGIKCLHAHYAWHLIRGNDPVGKWLEQYIT